jgi:diguanylate cyclase (GGDEF)-like protein
MSTTARDQARADALARLDAFQARSLTRLQDAGKDRSLLVELLEASCLLELAKIDATRFDQSSYLQLAVDIVAQMYPVHGVSATAAMPGARGTEVYSGSRPDHGRRYPLVTGGLTIGVMVTGAVEPTLSSPERFFELAATQIASGLATAIHAEQLRREAAAATAARVAVELDEDAMVDGLEELALAFASFPEVIASELAIEHAVVGPLLRLQSGYWDGDGNAHAIDSVTLDLSGGARLTTRLRSAGAAHGAEQAVHDVLKHLAGSLDRIAQTRHLREQAETEPLTGLGNRRRLRRALDHALGRADRYGEQVAVLLLDLDRFKPVNDELGHETGDAVIVACANALRDRTRSYDEIVRLGGDEFVVVAPVPDVLDALRLADDIRDEIARRCNSLLPRDWGLTATAGVAIFPDAGRDGESLLRAADAALYRAKDAGRDSVMVAEPAAPGGGPDGPAPRSFLMP